jgi:hypothetical protein
VQYITQIICIIIASDLWISKYRRKIGNEQKTETVICLMTVLTAEQRTAVDSVRLDEAVFVAATGRQGVHLLGMFFCCSKDFEVSNGR